MQPVLDVLAALNAAQVDYVVVGGVAVVLRGHPRMTVDLDLVVDLRRDNLLRALEALAGLGLRPRLPVAPESFADEATREDWVRHRNLIAFTLHDPADARREVDLFADPPIAFGELAAAADRLDVGGISVPVASVAHLVDMKLLADRPQDRADIAALSQLTELPIVDHDD